MRVRGGCLRLGWLAVTFLMLGTVVVAQQKEAGMHHAKGMFTVVMAPLQGASMEGVARYSIEKQIHGDLEATSKGEMFSAGDPKAGTAGYVAMEVVTGTLEGKHGSFALQHSATMDASGNKMSVTVVPGSGTGDLKGITGTFVIVIEAGKHTYDFAYELPG